MDKIWRHMFRNLDVSPASRENNATQVRRKVRLLNFSRSSRWAQSNGVQSPTWKDARSGVLQEALLQLIGTSADSSAESATLLEGDAHSLWPRVASSQRPQWRTPQLGSLARGRVFFLGDGRGGGETACLRRRRARRRLPSPFPWFEPWLFAFPAFAQSLTHKTHSLPTLHTHARTHSLTR